MDFGLKHDRLSVFLGLLMLLATYVPLAHGQQVGVSLKLLGVTIPNNSLVDIDNLLYSLPGDPVPTNTNGLHEQALLCVTDLEDCCTSPHTRRGEWYYPDGTAVPFDTPDMPGTATFRRNRGPNEVVNGRKFYGSVRLWRRWSSPPGRGRFRCELPNAAYPNISQTLYVNIVKFSGVKPVNLLTSGPGIAGNAFSLSCSATLIDPIPLPSNVPSPTFEWLIGPEGSASLPSGVIPTDTIWLTGNTYSSTLQFSPALTESHAGMYTCQIGADRLANSTVVSVDVGIIQITPRGALTLGQSNYTLTCSVSVADHIICPCTTYQWTKNNGTIIKLETGLNSVLSFSPLSLSDTGQYTCQATIRSFRVRNITVMGTHDVRIQIPRPTSVTISSSNPNPVRPIGSAVTLTCTVHVELNPAVDVPVILNVVWTGPESDGLATVNTSHPIMRGITATYTSTAIINSFGRSHSGVYICTAILSSSSTEININNSTTRFNSIRVTTGVYLALVNHFIANNTQINIRSIGLSSDSNNSALQCITDKNPCCFSQSPQHGEWYLPNRIPVQGIESDTAFYRCRGDNGEVYLNRPTNVSISQTGRLCCEVPDATDINQTLCVIIDRISIITFGSPIIAGEGYTLECSAGGSMARFEWLGPPNGKTLILNGSSITVSSTHATSQLQFRPLQQSHNGSYSCRAITDQDTLTSEPIEINVQAPSISVQIDSASGIAGNNFDLICRILGAETLIPSITYRWTKNSSSSQIQVGTNSNTLLFTPVRLSDAATYSCTVIIASDYLTSNITAMISQSVIIQIPTSSSITLASNVSNSLQIVGSDVILTCTVKLNIAILGSEIFLVTVDAQLSRDRTPLALIGPVVTGTTFTYTTQLNPFQKSDFGNYTCTATIRPQTTSESTYLKGVDVFSDILRIKAVIPPPIDVQATQSNSAAPVEVSWSPPSNHGPFNITGYRIFHGSGQNISVSTTIASVGLRVGGNYDGELVFLRSEADQLYSELVNVSVHIVDRRICELAFSHSNEVGIALGVVIVVVCLIVVAIIVLVAQYWWRKKSSIKKNLITSENMAYTDVNLKNEGIEGEYENLADMVPESPDQWKDNKAAVYSTILCTSKPPASQHTGTD